MHRLAFEQRKPLDHAMFFDLFRKLVEQIASDLRVSQLASAELDGNLYSVALLQEFDCPPDLGIEVADADLRLEADFLEGYGLLSALGFLLALGQFVLVLTEIEESRHGGTGQRCDLHQVEPPLLRKPQGVGCSHDAKLATVFVDNPHVEHADHLVDAQVSANGEPLLCVFRLPAAGVTCPKADERPNPAHSSAGRSPAGL